MQRRLDAYVAALSVPIVMALGAPGSAQDMARRSPCPTPRAAPVEVVNAPTVHVASMPSEMAPGVPSSPEPLSVRIELPARTTRGSAMVPDACQGRYLVVEQVSAYVAGILALLFTLQGTDGHPADPAVTNSQILALPYQRTPGYLPPPQAMTQAVTLRFSERTARFAVELTLEEYSDPEYLTGASFHISGYCVDVP